MDKITRQQAITKGLKRYFTGNACKRGHICERYVLRSVCIECHALWKRPKAYSNAYQKHHRRMNPEKALLVSARTRAKRLGIEFSLTLDNIIIPTCCPVFGMLLKTLGGKREHNTLSLDRIDTTKGYIPGNVRVISWRANHLKSNLTLKEAKELVCYMESALDK